MLFSCLLLVSECFALSETWQPVRRGPDYSVLLQAHIMFRHGHRVPMKSYPRDPNANATLWDDGHGQLTNIGRRQAFELGENLRSRYGILLPKERAWRSVRTLSSDQSRTLMSAQTVLAGLLPPRGSDRWSDLNWQPAPVHTRPQRIDNTIAASLPQCPRYLALQKALPNDISSETRKMYDYVEKHSGKKITSSTSIANLYTCLDIERQAGLRLPEWTRSVYPEPMKTETVKSFQRSVATKEMARLRVGPLLKEILHFDENNTGEPLRLYSTHDTVLSAFLSALGIEMNVPPNFVSVISVEYWKTPRKEIYVQLWWREGPDGELIQLEWPGCGRDCSLHDLKHLLKPLIPKNWNSECVMTNETLSSTEKNRDGGYLSKTVFVVCFIILTIGIPLYALIKCQSRSGGNAYQYVR